MTAINQTESSASDRTSDTSRLTEFADEHVHLLKAPDSRAYGQVRVQGRTETWRLDDPAFADWLRVTFKQKHGRFPGPTAVKTVIEGLQSEARMYGDETTVALRTAWDEATRTLYLDLANARHQVVCITSEGWRVLPNEEVPVVFQRPTDMQPLPVPEPAPTGSRPGDAIGLLRPLVNVGSDENWLLLVGWLLGALHPTGPYPLLDIDGEQGSGKSGLTVTVRRLLDPATAPHVGQLYAKDTLPVLALHNRVVALDNLSKMPQWFSDALCRLATGAGEVSRQYYTNYEQVSFSVCRPVVVNGISELATAPDLLRRTILLTVPTIPPEQSRSEDDLKAAFVAAAPRILGGLLDGVATALANWNRVPVPRGIGTGMLDFVHWVEAGAPAFGWASHAFLTAYSANATRGAQQALEASPVGRAVLTFMDQPPQCHTGKWQGIATDLLQELREVITPIEEHTLRDWSWPANGKVLSDKLRRIAPALRKEGVDVHFEERTSTTRKILLKQRPRAHEQGPGDIVEPYPALRVCLGANLLRVTRADAHDAHDADISASTTTTSSRRKKEEHPQPQQHPQRASSASRASRHASTTYRDWQEADPPGCANPGHRGRWLVEERGGTLEEALCRACIIEESVLCARCGCEPATQWDDSVDEPICSICTY